MEVNFFCFCERNGVVGMGWDCTWAETFCGMVLLRRLGQGFSNEEKRRWNFSLSETLAWDGPHRDLLGVREESICPI